MCVCVYTYIYIYLSLYIYIYTTSNNTQLNNSKPTNEEEAGAGWRSHTQLSPRSPRRSGLMDSESVEPTRRNVAS